nr:hypothetical protein [Tanacetum cinerariifolium]
MFWYIRKAVRMNAGLTARIRCHFDAGLSFFDFLKHGLFIGLLCAAARYKAKLTMVSGHSPFKPYAALSKSSASWCFSGEPLTTWFGVFVHDMTKKLPKFTPFRPTLTYSSMEDYTMLLNDQPKKELIDLMCGPVYTEAQQPLWRLT